MNLNFFFEQAAVGLSKEEMFRVMLSLKLLVDSKPLQTVRFWGKMPNLIKQKNFSFSDEEI